MKTLYFILALSLLVACQKKLPDMEYHAGEIDPTNFVAIGSANSAGYADDALHADAQKYSVANLLNEQLAKVGAGIFRQPLVSDASVGSNATGLSKLVLGYKTDCNGESSLSPIRFATSGDAGIFTNSYASNGPFNNLSVPDADLLDLQKTGWGNTGNSDHSPYYARMASNTVSSSILADAVALNPTFFSIYMSESEVMEYATSGGTSAEPIPANGANGLGFDGTLANVISSLSANGAKGVIANIPDVTTFPYFTTIPWNGLDITQEDADALNQVFNPLGITFNEGVNPFTIEDTSTTYNVRLMEEGELILLSVPLDSIKCYGMGTIHPIPSKYILSLDEIAILQSYITSYNAVIQSLATSNNLALVNLNALYEDLYSGILYNGISLNSKFVSGGAFSLDGKTMSPIGNAIITNLFIKSINAKFNAAIPLLDVGDYRGNLFP